MHAGRIKSGVESLWQYFFLNRFISPEQFTSNFKLALHLCKIKALQLTKSTLFRRQFSNHWDPLKALGIIRPLHTKLDQIIPTF